MKSPLGGASVFGGMLLKSSNPNPKPAPDFSSVAFQGSPDDGTGATLALKTAARSSQGS